MTNSSSMTALVSAFARAFHQADSPVRAFSDPAIAALLSPEEQRQIAASMLAGKAYFLGEAFSGSDEEALRRIVNGHLAPSPLGRSAWAEEALLRAVKTGGAKQYVLLGAGYDTFSLRLPDWAKGLTVFEVDLPETQADKRRRIERTGQNLPETLRFVPADLRAHDWTDALLQAGYSPRQPAFFSALGLSYYLSGEEFSGLLKAIFGLLCPGGAVAFDYPAAQGEASRQEALAAAAGEPMRAAYTPETVCALLSEAGFLLYEDLSPEEIAARYFAACNAVHPDAPLLALPSARFALAVRR